ncbi:MAG: sulfotransferase domain-containing protein [Candidatus Helarchaeota archaeon]
MKHNSKLVRIYSHPRSGTHLLAKYLKINFYQDYDLTFRNGRYGHYLDRKKLPETDYGKLIAGHNIKKLKPEHGFFIYLIRDPRGVALSIWKTKTFLNPKMRNLSFSDYLRTPLDWIMTPSHPTKKGKTIFEHWYYCITTWFSYNENNKNILTVYYEELVEHPKRVMDFIKNSFGLVYNDRYHRIHELIGIEPNEGKIDAWKQYFTDDDLKYMFTIIPKDFKFLYFK